jgi:hypothetical protein
MGTISTEDKNSVQYRVGSLKDLNDKIIPHFSLLQRKLASQPRKKEPSVLFFRPHYRDNGGWLIKFFFLLKKNKIREARG